MGGVATALLLAALFPLLSAAAESPVDSPHQEFVKPDKVLSREKGEEAARRFEALKPQLDAMKPEERAKALELETHSHLLRGDAAGAVRALETMSATGAATKTANQTAYLVGIAAGDAQLAERSLEAWAAEDANRRDALLTRKGGIALIGFTSRGFARMPGTSIKLIVNDFWSPAGATARSVAALSRAAEMHAADSVEFVGWCSADEAAAKSSAGAKRPGTQFYADSKISAADVRKEEGITQDIVLITTPDGTVRAAATGDDPAFHYALRAAVAEAAGTYDPIKPRNRAGQVGEPLGRAGSPPDASAPPPAAKPAAGPLPSDPEAAKLLDQARLFVRTGKKTDARRLFQEVIDRFPNTREAAEAAERIRGL